MLGNAVSGLGVQVLGSHGMVLLPLGLVGVAVGCIIYRNDGLPIRLPLGIGMALLGYLTMLSTMSSNTDWSGALGGLLGAPLVALTGEYIGSLVAAGIMIGGVALLPRGIALLAMIGVGFEFLIETTLSAIEGVFSKKDTEEEEGEEEEVVDEEEQVDPRAVATTKTPSPSPAPVAKKAVTKEPEPEPEKAQQIPKSFIASEYIKPPLSLLSNQSSKGNAGDVEASGQIIIKTLGNFGIEVAIEEVSTGPSITRFALRPSDGLKLSRILQLRNELSLALAAHPIRIEAPIPGKSLVGIEIPNKSIAMVGLRGLLEDKAFSHSANPLTVALGRGISGRADVANVAKIPHLLIAGTTGSGKSVMAHNLIMSLLYRNGPDMLRMLLIDPKRVELTLYNSLPHLLTPVIKDAKKTIIALRWAAKEMDRRYHILEACGVRDIASYHQTIVGPAYESGEPKEDGTPLPEKMPYILIVIDELADIMQTYPRELESGIVRLAQMSRAVGIHLVISTQRPSVNVITGLIKANIPGRIALRVSSQIDSRTIIDQPGAESLLGRGDMLFLGEGMSKPERIQSAYITEEEIKSVVAKIVLDNRGFPPDHIELGESISTEGAAVSESFEGSGGDEDDSMYEEAKQLVLQTKIASTSFIQRKLRVGYSRAARLVDLLEERGIIGPANGARPREIMGGSESSSAEESYDTDITEDEE
jgi:S-DNA-T family DNA segregation ATPase FtsK/SpoIIIE